MVLTVSFWQLALLAALAGFLGYSAGWFSGQRALSLSLLRILAARIHSPLAQDLRLALGLLSTEKATKWRLVSAWLSNRLTRKH